jgi:uncharacterized protein with NRDE domain
MCLVLLAWHAHAHYPLVLAANRDEFHARPAARARFWHDATEILAGRDLQAGGSWLGISRSGRFAAVTNVRGDHDPAAAESRGALVARFLVEGARCAEYAAEVFERRGNYSGFNLLLGDWNELWWVSNRDSAPRRLERGIYGLGNRSLDTPDVAGPRARFAQVLERTLALEPIFAVLEAERIVAPEYGTRCATVLLGSAAGRLLFAEREFDASGAPGDTVRFEFARTA